MEQDRPVDYQFAMKIFRAALLTLALVTTGCVTSQEGTDTWGPAQHRYPEEVLGLRLGQDVQSADLLLTLTNLTSYPITNFFPRTVFEGSVWILEEGTVPLQTYASKYFALLTTTLWVNPLTVLPPEGCLNYRIPLETLICHFHHANSKPRVLYSRTHSWMVLTPYPISFRLETQSGFNGEQGRCSERELAA